MNESIELLQSTLTRWASVYGQQYDEDACDVWMATFGKTPTQILGPAIARVTAEARFRPVPGDLSKAIELELSNSPFKPEPKLANCRLCGGSGWRLVPRKDDTPGHWAVKCEHSPPSKALRAKGGLPSFSRASSRRA